MANGYFNDLPKRTFADKILRDKAFQTPKNAKYDGYQRELVSMLFKYFDKKTSGGAVNKELANKLHKLIIRKFLKQNVQSCFIDSIWVAYLADMKL